MKKIWLLKVLKIIKDNVIMKKHNALKLTMFFLGISLAMVLYFVGLSNAQLFLFDDFGTSWRPLSPTSYNPSDYDGGVPPPEFFIDIMREPDPDYFMSYGSGPSGGYGGYPNWSGYPNYGSYGTTGGYGFGYQQSYNPCGYQQSSDPYGPGYQQPPLYDIPSFNDNEYWDPYQNTWMVYDEWNNMTYEKPIPYNGNPNPYPSPWGSSGPGVIYVGYPPPTPKLSYLRI